MPHLLSRTMFALRPRLATFSASSSSSTSILSATRSTSINLSRQFAAPVSTKPRPHTPRLPNPTKANKIPPEDRPLSRDPVPPPTITPEELETRPYVIRRTPFAQLPVYRVFKAGGSKIVVLIKKVKGDKKVLVEELHEKLGIDKTRIALNPTTGHVELKGDYLDQTRNYLLKRGY